MSSHALPVPVDPPLSNTRSPRSAWDTWSVLTSRRRKWLLASLLLVGALFLLFSQSRLDTDQRVCLDPLDLQALHAVPTAPPTTVTVSATVAVTVTAPPAVQTHVISQETPSVEPIVFGLIMWSLPSAIEGAILLKSAIMYTSRPLEFHVVCDDTSEAYLSQRLALLTHPVHNITVRFYRPSWQSMVDRIDRDSTIKTNHLAGVPGLMKLFLHEIFPDQVTKAIYVDTDAFFLTDPVLLWNRFATMNDTVAISMPTHPDQAAPQWHDANKICSCIMLLNFERLRNMRLMDSVIYRDDDSGLFPPALSPPTFEALFGPTDSEGHFENGGLGDQEYFWAIVKGRPDIFEHLPYDWEVSSCLLDMYGTRIGQDDATMDEERAHMVHVYQTPHEHQVILPKLVHFNCLFGVDVYFEWDGWYDPENTLTANWGSALDYHVGIKWIWLNRGHGKVDVATIMDPLFSDQRFARWREQTAST